MIQCCAPLGGPVLTDDEADELETVFKALADPVRLRLLSLVLAHEGAEACVCDLLPHFDLSQPTISHHLKVLHDAGLLHREKRGTWVFYLARPEAMDALGSLFAAAGSSSSQRATA